MGNFPRYHSICSEEPLRMGNVHQTVFQPTPGRVQWVSRLFSTIQQLSLTAPATYYSLSTLR